MLQTQIRWLKHSPSQSGQVYSLHNMDIHYLSTLSSIVAAPAFIYIAVTYRAKLCRVKVTNFLKGDENFAQRIISPDENFARQSFAQQHNQNLSK